MTHDPAAHRVIDAILHFYRASEQSGAVSDMLDTVRRELAGCRLQDPPATARALPVAELLSGALDRMPPGDGYGLRAALQAAAHLFRWRQNPNYTAANMGAGFMASYGYVEFAGPKDALFHAPNIRVGLLVLGAGLHYPVHAHPAEEIYHPLTGDARWRRGEEEWQIVPPGHAIHHPPMTPHETKAGASTLLALYCWRGDTATEARLTP